MRSQSGHSPEKTVYFQQISTAQAREGGLSQLKPPLCRLSNENAKLARSLRTFSIGRRGVVASFPSGDERCPNGQFRLGSDGIGAA